MKKSSTSLIRDFLQMNGVKQKQLAKELGTTPSNLNQKLKKEQIDTGLLYQISKATKHDFFADLSKQLQEDMRKEGSELKAEEAKKHYNTNRGDNLEETLRKIIREEIKRDED